MNPHYGLVLLIHRYNHIATSNITTQIIYKFELRIQLSLLANFKRRNSAGARVSSPDWWWNHEAKDGRRLQNIPFL
jgi:hypothetical protein